ncbi:hypothetical protein MFUL124B02_11300 [Myxococcus fulvus 124B02]|nr:hypothetical protein MFUL124B02_11300 [Myxococcus fulvus 124B02]
MEATPSHETRARRSPARVGQLKALQAGLDQSPRVRGLAHVGTSLNPRAPTSAQPIQRMEWRKKGDGLVAEDTGYTGPEPDPLSIPPGLVENDIWNDVTNHVYKGDTGLLRFHHQAEQPGDSLVPEELRTQFELLNKDPSIATTNAMKSYKLKLDGVFLSLGQWLEGQRDLGPVGPETQEAVDRLQRRIKSLRDHLVRHAGYPKLPAKEPERAQLAQGGAAARLYAHVTPATLTDDGTMEVPIIDSSKRVTAVEEGAVDSGEVVAPPPLETIDTHALTPADDGLAWWASAAMGLRQAAKTALRGKLLSLGVGTGRVPIGVKVKNDSAPQGEFIVLGHDAPIAHDKSPEQLGLRTPSDAAPEHRVSYPAFLSRLSAVQKDKGVSDPEVAQAMLRMVKSPGVDPGGVPDEVLPLLREMLVTWMVAEPARHRSVIFNSVLSLQEIANGTQTFAQMLPDKGRYPMAGKGTAKEGRLAEEHEEALLAGKNVTASSKVETRQKEQLKRTSTDGDLSSPLEQILHEQGIGGSRLRYLP